MYEINRSYCGTIGFHSSRVGAQSRVELHIDEPDHSWRIVLVQLNDV